MDPFPEEPECGGFTDDFDVGIQLTGPESEHQADDVDRVRVKVSPSRRMSGFPPPSPLARAGAAGGAGGISGAALLWLARWLAEAPQAYEVGPGERHMLQEVAGGLANLHTEAADLAPYLGTFALGFLCGVLFLLRRGWDRLVRLVESRLVTARPLRVPQALHG